jgi:hypothetical protein
MSKEQHDALTDAGINPDQVLHSTMKKGHAKASPGWRCWQLKADSPRWHMARMPMIQRICGRVVLWLEEGEGGVADQAVRFGGRLMLTEALNINRSPNAPRFLFDYQSECLEPVWNRNALFWA